MARWPGTETQHNRAGWRPGVAVRARRMRANGALGVDLLGQVAADSLGGRQYSGIGGHEDFVMAATAAHDGHSLVCLPSTSEVDGQRVSRIVADTAAWTAITTPRHHVDVVVTEAAAICAYLADRFADRGLAPPPDAPARGRYYRYLFFPGVTLEPLLSVTALGVEDIRPQSMGWGDVERGMTAVEAMTPEVDWALGDRFTAADVVFGGARRRN